MKIVLNPDPCRVLRSEFDDVEQFNETVRDWNTDFRQVDRGTLHADLMQWTGRASILTWCHFTRAIAQTGGTPPGMRAFGIRVDSSPWLEWCNRKVGRDSILCFHPGGEFESLSLPGFAVFALSFQEAKLVTIAERLGYPGFFDELRTEEAVDAAGSDGLPRLRTLLRRTLSYLDAGRFGTNSIRTLDEIENRIAETLVLALVETRSESTRETQRNRSRVVKVAISHILEHAREAVSVADLCAVSGVSWRTLNRAFKESIGASPKACISAVRLRGARRELRRAEPTASVAGIANNWGFWHMGDFAMNYRREFGELPSDTLRKQKRHQGTLGASPLLPHGNSSCLDI